MKIEILGTSCAKCVALQKVVEEAVSKVGGFHQVVKVDDIMEIMNYQVLSTPGLVIDGEVKSTGKLLSLGEVTALLEAAMQK